MIVAWEVPGAWGALEKRLELIVAGGVLLVVAWRVRENRLSNNSEVSVPGEIQGDSGGR